MKLIKKLKEQENGSITMTVIALMLFVTGSILIAYFSLSNQSNNQSKKIKQISDSYKVTNSQLIQEYKNAIDEINAITTMSITEAKGLANYMIGKQTNTIVTDDLENTFVVPAGFKVTDDADNVTEGMVIQDKDGNEFVWIPVGIPKTSNTNETIELARYDFKNATDSTAGTILQTKTDGSALRPSGYSVDFTEDIKNNTGKGLNGNAIAKDIEDFKTKTNAAGGFWIGRYEARVEDYTGSVVTSNSNHERSWTGYTGGKLVEKPGAQVFNYITQNKAAELSRTMYSSDYFESDLINSYAWDTATLFLQEYDNREGTNLKPYSRQDSINTGSQLETGTVLETNKDKICNVYDMASNCAEWTTETSSYSSNPCVGRGGYYGISLYCTCRTRQYQYNGCRRWHVIPPCTLY